MSGFSCSSAPPPARRHGAVGVIVRDQQLLVIRRSQFVAAPGQLCFPGGAIEAGESAVTAVQRELHEELSLRVQPVAELWHCQTPSGISLSWWHVRIDDPAAAPRANPAEVAEVFWMDPAALHAHPDLLTTNHQFLTAWRERQFTLEGLAPPTTLQPPAK